MENLYTYKVHPLPPPPATITDHLTLLPATILTLTTVLSLEDKEVLAYLISCCNNSKNFRRQQQQEHVPRFECNCFMCYMCFWSRWDKSPNREVIHEIIEAYEEGLLFQRKEQVKKKKKKGRRKGVYICEKNEFVKMNCQSGDHGEISKEVESEWGSIRKIVSFIGDSIWGVLNLQNANEFTF